MFCLFALVLPPGTAAAASLSGTRHDLRPQGAPQLCRECHESHYSYERVLWARNIIPNAGSETALCLDCHDPNRTTRPLTPAPPTWASKAADVDQAVGSRHDFSSRSWASRGTCAACHELHMPNQSHAAYVGTGPNNFVTTAFLWIRSLTEELADPIHFYQKRDITTLSVDDKSNFLIGSTAMCYDCHSGSADADAPDYSNDFINEAQDIAFGTNMVDDKGYYELGDGSTPTASNLAPTLGSVLEGVSPGGHFIRSRMADANSTDNYLVRNPDGRLLYKISVGDKLPCTLCHDPHRGETLTEDEVFFRRDMHAGMDTIVTRTETIFDGVKLEASANVRNGAGGDGDGRLMCIYCHGTSDWDGQATPMVGIAPLILSSSPRMLTLYGIRIRTPNNPPAYASSAIPPPNNVDAHRKDPGVPGLADDPPCSQCHLHNDMGSANCGSCHNFPPRTGAHAKHLRSQLLGGVQISCDVCHGVGAESAGHPGHPPGNRAIEPANIDIMGAAAYTGTRPSWFASTWGGPAYFGATDVSRGASLSDFTCVNVRCHGGGSIHWMSLADSGTFNNVCLDCHDATSSVFQLPGVGTPVYRASAPAINYVKTLSGFSRGGHGDTRINSASWFRDSAPGTAVPLACVACHDESQPHFGIAAAKPQNPYRVSDIALQNNLPGRDLREGPLSNLCTQTGCHPKFLGTGNYAFLSPPKHPSDHWPISDPRDIYVPNGAKPVNNQSAGSTTVSPHYDPVGVDLNGDPAVGLHIDRYQDHWEWWNPSRPATPANSDNVPFLPLGDSLTKSSGGVYDNDTATLVTCVTCHNPHGTDLYVKGQIPGSASTYVNIPSYKMLRLNWDDDELCGACH